MSFARFPGFTIDPVTGVRKSYSDEKITPYTRMLTSQASTLPITKTDTNQLSRDNKIFKEISNLFKQNPLIFGGIAVIALVLLVKR